MPGQIPLDTRYYPSDFNIHGETIVIPATGLVAMPLLYADRAMIIDSVTMYVFGNVAITPNAVSLKIKQVPASAEPVFGTATQDIGSFTTLPVATTVAATQTLSFSKTNNNVNNNQVPAGSWVWFQTFAVGSITNTPTVVVQIRYRSQS